MVVLLPRKFLTPLMMIFALVLTSCGLEPGPAATPSATPTASLVPTPTETPIPMAVVVNGAGIPLLEFKAELARYQQAQASLGNTVSLESANQVVSDDLIETLLLEQGAAAAGFIPDNATVQGRIDALAAQMGGADGLAVWETAHGYTEADFRSSLRRQIAAAWMRDRIASSVATTAGQVHVKQVLLYNEGDAQQALGYLQSGWNFDDLAARYDPLTKGELGWFPRGYLPSQAIEDAVFALQPGEYSAIIQDETGYHILFVVERDPDRLLSPDALLTLQERAVQNWLTQKRNESTILFTP
jgi:peptidyl-prolyl cis-trans isomerase C